MGPPGVWYSGRTVDGFWGFCVRQYMEVRPGASKTLTSSGSEPQKDSPARVAPAGRCVDPSFAAMTSSALTDAGLHPTCTSTSCTASAAASSMSTSFAPLTVLAM